MCRYAMYGPYKRHFACFKCRKAFKQPPVSDYLGVQGLSFAFSELSRVQHHPNTLQRREGELGVTLAEIESRYVDAIHKCPECSEPMIDMGLDFKPPRQADTKAWRNLHGMYRVGHAFHTCGCDGPGWIPVSSADYAAYLADRKQRYDVQLNRIQNSDEMDGSQKRDAATYWQSRLAAVDAELAAIS